MFETFSAAEYGEGRAVRRLIGCFYLQLVSNVSDCITPWRDSGIDRESLSGLQLETSRSIFFFGRSFDRFKRVLERTDHKSLTGKSFSGPSRWSRDFSRL